MAIELIIVFCIIGCALIIFISGVVAIDQTAILIMVALMVSGVLTPEEAVSGFSNAATLTVLALLIISAGLKNTGAVDEAGDMILKIVGKNEIVTIITIMLIAAIFSAFINTTAVVAIFIPIMFKISERANIKVSLLLMPLSFAAMIGGASTMIGTSTNLLINSLANINGVEKFRIFDLTIFGIILLSALVLYIIFVGIIFLRKKTQRIKIFDQEVEADDYLTEIRVPAKSNIINQKIGEVKLYDKTKFTIKRLVRNGRSLRINEEAVIKEGDIITVKTNIHEIIYINNNPDLEMLTNPQKMLINEEGEEDENRLLFEALIIPNSNLIGRKIRSVSFKRYYDAFLLASRSSQLLGEPKLMDHTIKVGDIFLMDSSSTSISQQSNHDWTILRQISRQNIERQIKSHRRMFIAIGILATVILLAVNEIFPILVSAWLGVALIFLTGCISVKKAYENVEWKVIFLLAGIIPLGIALSKTGGDQFIAEFIVSLTKEASPRVVISVMFIFTTLMTGIISNQATAVILVPIALKVAVALSIPAQPLLVAILFGANTSFITPMGYQTNAMVYGPGNYRFIDFLKVGGILTLIFWALATWLIPIMYL